MKKKLLILGSDYSTSQVVRVAHEMGLYVIAADLMETSPTKKAADESWLISTTDVATLTKLCKENEVSALMFGASDFNIWNSRLVCKELGLPIFCESDYACRVARDKGEFKRICKEVGAPIAQDYYISDALTDSELSAVVYPVVVKPADKSGNRGMSYCCNEAELISAYKAAREVSDKEIIVERQLHGDEYNVHYVLADGKAQLLYFNSTHHEPGESDNVYSFKCTTNYHLKQFLEEVNEKVVAVLEKAECKEGIAWVDCIRDDDGKFYLLELGYRFGGVMTYVPYQKVTGFDTIRWMIECALGVQHKQEDLPNIKFESFRGTACSYHLFTKEEGVIKSVEGLSEIEKLPNVYVDMPKRGGNTVRKNACMGLLGIYARDADELCSTLKRINQVLRVNDVNGMDMIIHYDDYDLLKKEYAESVKEFA